MKLTKRTIEKLYAAPIDVNLWNGNFNKASVKIQNNKIGYELTVEDTHPILREMSIVKEPRTTFVVWHTPYRGTHMDLPEELEPLAERLLLATVMSDKEAYEILNQMTSALEDFYTGMGWLK